MTVRKARRLSPSESTFFDVGLSLKTPLTGRAGANSPPPSSALARPVFP